MVGLWDFAWWNLPSDDPEVSGRVKEGGSQGRRER